MSARKSGKRPLPSSCRWWMTMATKKLPNYDAPNLQAARIILADVERYGGEGAGLVVWARAVAGEKNENSEKCFATAGDMDYKQVPRSSGAADPRPSSQSGPTAWRDRKDD
jgi:hypothetical protein